MSAVFYNKYRSLFFDEHDPEPLSFQYFNSKPKNYLNLSPNLNIPSLAQQYSILPRDLEIPVPRKARVEEITEVPQPKPLPPQRREYEKPKSKIDDIFNYPQTKPPAPQRLEPLEYKPLANKPPSVTSFEINRGPGNEYMPEQQQIIRESPKRAISSHKLPPIGYENTKSNIFPDKPEPMRQGNPIQEAMKRRKESKSSLNERRQRLREVLSSDKVL